MTAVRRAIRSRCSGPCSSSVSETVESPRRVRVTALVSSPRRDPRSPEDTSRPTPSTSVAYLGYQVVPQPRHRGELHAVGLLVQAHPQPEVGVVDAQLAFGLGDVRRDEEQASGPRPRRREQLVLTEDLAGQPGQGRSGLGAGERRRRLCARCWRARVLAGQRLLEGRQHEAHAVGVGPDPARPVDDLDGGRRCRSVQPGVGPHVGASLHGPGPRGTARRPAPPRASARVPDALGGSRHASRRPSRRARRPVAPAHRTHGSASSRTPRWRLPRRPGRLAPRGSCRRAGRRPAARRTGSGRPRRRTSPPGRTRCPRSPSSHGPARRRTPSPRPRTGRPACRSNPRPADRSAAS